MKLVLGNDLYRTLLNLIKIHQPV